METGTDDSGLSVVHAGGTGRTMAGTESWTMAMEWTADSLGPVLLGSERSGQLIMSPSLLAYSALVAPTIAAVAALISSLRNRSKIEQVHLAVNSRLDELLKLTKTSSYAEGKAAGEFRQRDST